MGKLFAGVAKVIITPPIGIPLAGYGERDKLSTAIHDELYAKALVLSDGKTKAAIVTTDLAGVDKEFVSSIRKQVQKRTDIKKENILISASHTHSGPDMSKPRFFTEEKVIEGLSKKDYVDSLREVTDRKIAGAVLMADNNMKEARVGVGKGVACGVAANRRDSKGPMDNTVGVLRVDDEEGKHMAILVNFCGHPTVLSFDNYLISADYPGYAMRAVENAIGEDVIAMFTNGACGNVSTRFTRREQTFREAKRLGSILGGEVIKVSEEIETRDQGKLKVISKKIRLPAKRFPTIREAEEDCKTAKDNFERLKAEGATKERLRVSYTTLEGAERLVEWVKKGIGKIKEVETEMQAIAIDDTVLIAEPGELFVEIGLDIKKKAGLENVFVVGYANDSIGYVPTREAYKEGKYEAFSTILSPEAGEIIHKTALELISKVKSKDL